MDSDDVDHERAVGVLSAGTRPLTTDYVLVETWRLVATRLGYPVAERFWQSLRAGRARLERVEPVDLETAWTIGRRYEDQTFSLVDRTSFAVMERLGIRRATAFDSDFAIYRFGVDNSQAFTLVR